MYVVTNSLAQEIIKQLHENLNHIGVRKLHLIFRENYISKNDLSLIEDLLKRCELCQLGKEKNYHENIPRSISGKTIRINN